jgi:AMMECR1 domain-containing protein
VKKLSALLIFALTVISLCAWGSGDPIEQWTEFSRSKGKILFMKWRRENAVSIQKKEKNYEPLPVELPAVHGRSGLFITLMKKGKVRGCFGAFDHSETDIEVMLRDYLKGALSYDPRYKPLEKHELEETEIIVTVASFPEHVESLNKVDISRSGVLIECDDSAATVIVPAEFRTSSRLNWNNRYTNCRISSFRAVTIREEHQ